MSELHPNAGVTDTWAALHASADQVTDVELLRLRFGEGRSFNEIAMQSQVPIAAVKLRVSRAVERLRTDEGMRQQFGL